VIFISFSQAFTAEEDGFRYRPQPVNGSFPIFLSQLVYREIGGQDKKLSFLLGFVCQLSECKPFFRRI
jgi:hypothetical protein